jgi:hypothetical protein
MRKLLLASLSLSALLLLPALPAAAQATSDVRFERGTSGATLSGTLIGDEYVDYRLGAKRGQLMIASIEVDGTNEDGTIYFNILPPGSSGEAIWNGSMSTDGIAEVTLPEDGTYTIRTYLMGNGADTGRTVGYKLHVAIQ